MSNFAAKPTVVAASASSALLLAAQRGRKGATIYNKCDKILHVAFATPATVNNAVVNLAAEASGIGGYYEVPFGYNGPVYGIWESGPTGQANVTELS